MKKLMFVVVALCLVASLAYAAPIIMKGTIIDNACASNHMKDMATFIETHTKDCALMPVCVESGYSIYSDGKLTRFNAANDSNKKIANFLKMKDSKLTVEVGVTKIGDKLDLVSIKNAK